MSSLSSLVDVVRSDIAKLLRYAAVSAVSVPLGLAMLWFFLDVVELQPVVANIVAVGLATIPNYLLNRLWVWNKRGSHSMRREIAPFWAMAFLGALVSSIFVALADQFTDSTLVFLFANLAAFGLVWIFKFVVIERFLFGDSAESAVEVAA